MAEMIFFGRDHGDDLLAIAELVLNGEIDATRGDLDAAVTKLEDAVAREDELPYNEPPNWYYPARHSLGAMQLAAGDPVAAVATYRADLTIMPENGWALMGLEQALQAQGDEAAAQAVRGRFEAAWRHADVDISASRI
jgi:tetratricopeptide (TPR) repeat protein